MRKIVIKVSGIVSKLMEKLMNEIADFWSNDAKKSKNENISVEVLYDNEDFWLTQKSMPKLFNVEVNTINYHLKEIFETHDFETKRK